MKIVLATHNKNKLREMRAMLSDFDIEVLSTDDIGFTQEVEENGLTFEENARIKARAISALGYIAIADDSGLCVDALNGAPGIYSARYAGEECDYAKNNELLLREMKDVPDEKRTAHFITAIVMSFPDSREIVCIGRRDGIILRELKGTDGFGYDPLFYIPETGKTFAELSAREKNEISHRGLAMKELKRKIARLPKEKEKYTVGIYGGTFAPPHVGHLHAINAFLSEGKIDFMLVIPSFIPPHKELEIGDKPKNRLEMTRLMLKNHPEYEKRIFVSDWEIEQGETSYTVNTLKHYSRFTDKLKLLIGTDMLMTFDQWKNPEIISSLCTLCYIPREEQDEEDRITVKEKIDSLTEKYNTKVAVLPSKALECSSTEIRENRKKGKDISKSVCTEVLNFINENSLYT